MKIVIGCLLVLSALMSSTAGAIPPSVATINIDMGTISVSPGSGEYCGLTSQLPPDLDQVNTLQSSGQVSFGSHAYTRQNGPNLVALCVDIHHNLPALGTFSGSEVITLQRNIVVTVTDTRTIGYSIDQSASGAFVAGLELNLKTSSTWTTSTRSSTTNSIVEGQKASFSIIGPDAADNYAGPVVIQIWRDNIYGSFMFHGVQ